MHNKPSSKGGSGVDVNTSGRMKSNAGVLPPSSSTLNNESLPSLAGNCSNDGGGSDSLYPDSVSGPKYDLRVIQKHPENSVEALKQEKGQLRTVNKELKKDQIRKISERFALFLCTLALCYEPVSTSVVMRDC
jgi:hypothetical protein